MKFKAIKACAGQFDITPMCRVLKVSRSGYYDWLKREPSKRAKQDTILQEKMKAIWQNSRQTYGVPRIHAELQAQGIAIGRKRVSRLMKLAGLKVRQVKPFKPTTTIADETHPVAANLLDRQFTEVKAANKVWLVDITYVATQEGWLYVAAVIDLYSRKIVGLAMADHMRSELVENALKMAKQSRRPSSGLLHHSDRGSQYTGHAYQKYLRKMKVRVSMSRKGDCWDNAPMESFWATLKRECVTDTFASRDEARAVIFDYVMSFYNRRRRHSSLGYLSPEHFEAQYETNLLSVKTGDCHFVKALTISLLIRILIFIIVGFLIMASNPSPVCQ